LKNLDLEKQITETNEHLSKHEKNVNIFDNLTEIASESLATHFDKVNNFFHEKFLTIELCPSFLAYEKYSDND
jgi:hypothetical protein